MINAMKRIAILAKANLYKKPLSVIGYRKAVNQPTTGNRQPITSTLSSSRSGTLRSFGFR